MDKELRKQGFIALTPAAGWWLTDGAVVSDAVFTPQGRDGVWREVDAVEATAIRTSQKTDADIEKDF